MNFYRSLDFLIFAQCYGSLFIKLASDNILSIKSIQMSAENRDKNDSENVIRIGPFAFVVNTVEIHPTKHGSKYPYAIFHDIQRLIYILHFFSKIFFLFRFLCQLY